MQNRKEGVEHRTLLIARNDRLQERVSEKKKKNSFTRRSTKRRLTVVVTRCFSGSGERLGGGMVKI